MRRAADDCLLGCSRFPLGRWKPGPTPSPHQCAAGLCFGLGHCRVLGVCFPPDPRARLLPGLPHVQLSCASALCCTWRSVLGRVVPSESPEMLAGIPWCWAWVSRSRRTCSVLAAAPSSHAPAGSTRAGQTWCVLLSLLHAETRKWVHKLTRFRAEFPQMCLCSGLQFLEHPLGLRPHFGFHLQRTRSPGELQLESHYAAISGCGTGGCVGHRPPASAPSPACVPFKWRRGGWLPQLPS